MNRRQMKKLLKRLHPGFHAWRGPRTSRKPRLARCPICGRYRRNGYFRSCGACAYILEYTEAIQGLCRQLNEHLGKQGARLYCDVLGGTLELKVCFHRRLEVEDIGEMTHAREDVTFSSSCRISLVDFRESAAGLKQCILDSVKTLYTQAMEKMTATVDSNGRMKRLAGCAVPVEGNWRE